MNNNTKNSIKPSNNLIKEVKRLLNSNNSKNNGIKNLTKKIRSKHPEWKNNTITEGKVRQAKKILSLKRKRRNKSKRSRNIPSYGLMRRIKKSMKGPHAKAALELAVHQKKGLPAYSRLPDPPPNRFYYN